MKAENMQHTIEEMRGAREVARAIQYGAISGNTYGLDTLPYSRLVSTKVPNTPLPGITKRTNEFYQPLFFGAKRAWANDDEGWQTVNNKKAQRTRRSRPYGSQDTIEHVEQGFFSGQDTSYLD
jgi:hypothetical protein